jgi:prevent-host-death family protein
MSTMTVSEARANLPALLDRVDCGEEIIITRHGAPAAVLVHPDMLRVRRVPAIIKDAERVHDLLEAARGAPFPTTGAVSEARAEELIQEIRAGRDRG